MPLTVLAVLLVVSAVLTVFLREPKRAQADAEAATVAEGAGA